MIDAYTWTTPNGIKLLIALEELQLPHTLHWVDIMKGEQHTPEFLAINPNNKIPAIVDREGPGGKPLAVFESGAVLLYLAEKAGQLLPSGAVARYEVLEWMFFQAGGTGPALGQLGFFTLVAPEKIPVAIERYTKETQRLFRVLDGRLAEGAFLVGDYSIADVMNITWVHRAATYGIDAHDYPHLGRWYDAVMRRPAVQRAYAISPPPTTST